MIVDSRHESESRTLSTVHSLPTLMPHNLSAAGFLHQRLSCCRTPGDLKSTIGNGSTPYAGFLSYPFGYMTRI